MRQASVLFFAGAIAAVGFVFGVQSVAAVAAKRLAESISTTETARHARSVEFSGRALRAAAEGGRGPRDARRETRNADQSPGRHDTMKWERIEAEWKKVKVTAKSRWDRLTDEQLETIGGRREQLIATIREAYGVTRETTERQIAQWQADQREDPQAEGPVTPLKDPQ